MTDTRPVRELHLHLDAWQVPVMTAHEIDALYDDIEKRGIVTPIEILSNGTILDGRHRWQVACTLQLDDVPVRVIDPADPVDFMIRAALLRRHLTTAQRKDLAASLLKSEPTRSDRSVATVVGISHPTVAVIRAEMETSGDVEEVSTRTDSVGREQPAHKAPAKVDPDHVEQHPDDEHQELSGYALYQAVTGRDQFSAYEAMKLCDGVVLAGRRLAKHDFNRVAEAVPLDRRKAYAKRLRLAERRIHNVAACLESRG